MIKICESEKLKITKKKKEEEIVFKIQVYCYYYYYAIKKARYSKINKLPTDLKF